MPLNFDKLDDYFLFFAALIPGAFGGGVIIASGFMQVALGIAILVVCVVLPAMDHMRASVVDDSPLKRIRSWLFMITSTSVMAMLVAAGVSVFNPLTWVGVVVIFGIVWFVVVQFRKTFSQELDPYDRMYLASGHVFGIFAPIIAYVLVALQGAQSLLWIGSPAIPTLFLVLAWFAVLLLVLVGKTEIISKKLLAFEPDEIQQQRRPRRFVRVLQDRFPYLVLSMLGMAVESGVRTKGVGISFLIAFGSFVALVVTVPEANRLGWDFITAQLLIANLALIANLIFFTRLTTAQIMNSGWIPRF